MRACVRLCLHVGVIMLAIYMFAGREREEEGYKLIINYFQSFFGFWQVLENECACVAQLYLVSDLKFLPTCHGQKCVSLRRNYPEYWIIRSAPVFNNRKIDLRCHWNGVAASTAAHHTLRLPARSTRQSVPCWALKGRGTNPGRSSRGWGDTQTPIRHPSGTSDQILG